MLTISRPLHPDQTTVARHFLVRLARQGVPTCPESPHPELSYPRISAIRKVPGRGIKSPPKALFEVTSRHTRQMPKSAIRRILDQQRSRQGG
ncbi:MAG: hypothetical protein WBP18_08245, partial [Paracoccaceae bacterium]